MAEEDSGGKEHTILLSQAARVLDGLVFALKVRRTKAFG